MAFQRIDIILSGPVCSCVRDESHKGYKWAIEMDENNSPGLHVWCAVCNTTLIVTNQKFRARFIIENEGQRQPVTGAPKPPPEPPKPKSVRKLPDFLRIIK